METVQIEKAELEKIKSMLVKADSMLSYLHHRGYIGYSLFGCPDKREVEARYGEIRATYEKMVIDYGLKGLTS